MQRIEEARFQRFTEQVLIKAGYFEEDARDTAGCLVYSDLCGVETHGATRLEQYIQSIRQGNINPRPEVRVLETKGSTATVDADGGYGFRPSKMGMELAIKIARTQGISAVGIKNSHHFGMAANYTRQAAELDMVGFIATTTHARIAPPGGLKAAVGTNPFSWAFPRRSPSPPIVLDIAVSQAALSKIRRAKRQGESIPDDWGYDVNGHPTTDPEKVIQSSLLAAIGGHKGYGLSVILELIAGVMIDSPFGINSDPHTFPKGGVGHFAIAINPGFFTDMNTYYNGVEDLVTQIKTVPLRNGTEEIYLPGEIEWNCMQDRLKNGIPISEEKLQQLNSLANELGVEALDCSL